MLFGNNVGKQFCDGFGNDFDNNIGNKFGDDFGNMVCDCFVMIW